VKRGERVADWDPFATPIITDLAGRVKFQDLIEGVTTRDETDENTGIANKVVMDARTGSKAADLKPAIVLIDDNGEPITPPMGAEARYLLPVDSILSVAEGDEVKPGNTLARVQTGGAMTRDITGGLPRVAELFEARRPRDPSVITEIDGTIRFGDIKRGKREIIVKADNGTEIVYEVPVGKHLRVHEGDLVRAGDRLSEGPVNPHDILRIKGPRAVQEYLLNEVQEVYRLQGVKINDKHIGVIVRQMLQKVKITEPGESRFLEGEKVDRMEFGEENQRLIEVGREPARSEPLLLGITKASLTTQSFISAASFQETTRVLTDAAIRGARDDLIGLKENIIIGHLIPAGTGVFRYQDVDFPGQAPPPQVYEREEAVAAVEE
jgi:DNA-directed RNA polymerase subunit beta'